MRTQGFPATSRSSIAVRIHRRIEVLRAWKRDGIPAGQALPDSLTGAREWDAPELGIQPISSPNEFTTTHELHGSSVREVAKLLKDIVAKYGQAASFRKSPGRRCSTDPDTKEHLEQMERQLKIVVSQWHSASEAHLEQKRRADAADSRAIILLAENRQKDELIADLRRQLASRQGLRVVE